MVKPALRAEGQIVTAEEESIGSYTLARRAGPGRRGQPPILVCENETNTARLFGSPDAPAHPKDGIGDHVLHGAPTVNPDGVGTKAAAWYRLTVAAGATVELRLRLRPSERTNGPGARQLLGAAFEREMAARESEADEFYGELAPGDCTRDERAVMRQAFAGMIWGKQFYRYDVARWLDGDPGQPPPPPSRLHGRNQTGATCSPPTSSRCPTRGSTRGSPPGTSPSTPSSSRTSTRRSRSTSCCCCAASGCSAPTARCRPTSGRSATSTRPCTPGRR